VHRVGLFQSIGIARASKPRLVAVSRELTGQNLVDPALANGVTRYANFSTRPLFADAGPTADDVRQGYLGDCYYLATLGSVAAVKPAKIEQSVVELGDGTYAVQFKRNGHDIFVRVDGDLPTSANGQLAYAGLGADDSVWVAIMEKAFAYIRTTVASYSAIEAGWMTETTKLLGLSSTSNYTMASASALMSKITQQLASGRAVTYATKPSVADILVGSHAYQVVSVTAMTVRLRNPWGTDGYSVKDTDNDGYVTLTAAQAFTALAGMTAAVV
jgi:hypothetical protein